MDFLPTTKAVGSFIVFIARRASIIVTPITPEDPIPRRGLTINPVDPLRGTQ